MKQKYISDNKEWMLDWDYENNSKLPSEVKKYTGNVKRDTLGMHA